jgi:hypothetical protein
MTQYWHRNIFISESHAYGVIHLSNDNDPLHTLCGKKSMRKNMPLEEWGASSNSYTCCPKCDQLKNERDRFVYRSPISFY